MTISSPVRHLSQGFQEKYGHERDGVEYRKTFLRRIISLSFINESNMPTEEKRKGFLSNICGPLLEVEEKNMVPIHNEYTFQSNVDQATLWAEKRMRLKFKKIRNYGF